MMSKSSTDRSDVLELPEDAVNVLVLTGEWDTGIGACTSGLTADSRFLVVTYSRPADHYVSFVRDHVDEGLEEFVIVEATQDGTGSAHEGVEVHLERPDKLAGIGLKTNELLTRWREEPGRATIYFDSITSLLQYTDLNGAYRFLHTYTGNVHNSGAQAYYNLVAAAHDEATIATLKQLFDTVLRYNPEANAYEVQ